MRVGAAIVVTETSFGSCNIFEYGGRVVASILSVAAWICLLQNSLELLLRFVPIPAHLKLFMASIH